MRPTISLPAYVPLPLVSGFDEAKTRILLLTVAQQEYIQDAADFIAANAQKVLAVDYLDVIASFLAAEDARRGEDRMNHAVANNLSHFIVAWWIIQDETTDKASKSVSK